MSLVTLTCLGVGDGTISGRNHSAYLYQADDTRVLVDCGEPVSRSLTAIGLGGDSIDHLFISHLHSDHISGLFMLLQGFWLDQRQKALSVRLPGDGIKPITQLLRTSYLFEELMPFKLRFQPLTSAQAEPVGPFSITPHPTTHLEKVRQNFQATYPGEYRAYCFEIRAGPVRIVHTADIGAARDLEPLLKQHVDLLVCEVAHVQPEELFTLLKRCSIKKIVFTHLARYHWQYYVEIRRQADSILGNMDYSFAEDGQSFMV